MADKKKRTSATRNVVIAGYVRSPFTPAKKGELAEVRPDELMAQTVRGLIDKTGVDPNKIEDLKIGCAFPEGEQGWNIARQVVFLAGLPKSTGGVTTNRFCGSSMQAVHDAVGMISAGMAEAVVCGGVESMSRVPMGGHTPSPNPKLLKDYPEAYIATGAAAENTAKQNNVTRDKQDAYAASSQQKAGKADVAGMFKDEIVAITTPSGKKVTKDGTLRPDTTVDGLKDLKPAFDENGTVTAGTASPLTDGAAALLVCSEEFAKENGLPVLATVKSYAVAAGEADNLKDAPVKALERALAKAELALDDLDVIELHEAFAAQAVAVSEAMKLDPEKLNRDGGAIASGHPLGASGAVRVGTAARILNRDGGKYAGTAMCIAGGQGIATILEAPANDNAPKADAKKPTPKKPAPKP